MKTVAITNEDHCLENTLLSMAHQQGQGTWTGCARLTPDVTAITTSPHAAETALSLSILYKT